MTFITQHDRLYVVHSTSSIRGIHLTEESAYKHKEFLKEFYNYTRHYTVSEVKYFDNFQAEGWTRVDEYD